MPLPEATRETALSRLRPVLMTALVVPAIYPWFARGLSYKEDNDDDNDDDAVEAEFADVPK